MPQGKFKVKNNAPVDKKKNKKISCARKNCPISSKKWKYEEGQKIKRLISKNVNKQVEEEIRAVATNAPKEYVSKNKKQVPQFVKTHK